MLSLAIPCAYAALKLSCIAGCLSFAIWVVITNLGFQVSLATGFTKEIKAGLPTIFKLLDAVPCLQPVASSLNTCWPQPNINLSMKPKPLKLAAQQFLRVRWPWLSHCNDLGGGLTMWSLP